MQKIKISSNDYKLSWPRPLCLYHLKQPVIITSYPDKDIYLGDIYITWNKLGLVNTRSSQTSSWLTSLHEDSQIVKLYINFRALKSKILKKWCHCYSFWSHLVSWSTLVVNYEYCFLLELMASVWSNFSLFFKYLLYHNNERTKITEETFFDKNFFFSFFWTFLCPTQVLLKAAPAVLKLFLTLLTLGTIS